MNAASYQKHLRQQLLPDLDQLYPEGNCIYVQDGATSHTATSTQDFLKETLGKGRFLSKTQWPPSSPNCNVLDYYLWDHISKRVYEGRNGVPFENEEQLKRRIRYVWNDAIDMDSIRKAINQFQRRLRAMVFANGNPIKKHFS